MIDFHSHILPNMDDGAKSIEESIKLLEMLENEDVEAVCLTPHFYPNNEDIESFLKRREKSYKELKNSYKSNLKLLLGAEVRYYRGISNNNDISKLTLENTKILLLELPFQEPISESMLQEIVNLSKNQHLTIVLAHIERYNIDDDMLKNLKNVGILIQANTESFIGLFRGRQSINRLKKGLIDLIGSDTHNLDTRIPNYLKASQIITKKLGKEVLETLNLRAKSLIKQIN